jgi:outer membrane lipase/esterase
VCAIASAAPPPDNKALPALVKLAGLIGANFMALQWMRRALLVAASASVLLLASCGGGSVESKFSPSRVIAFGDAMADVGQTGSRYTVNDGSVNNWTQFVANSYDRTIAPSSAGGLSYAWGNARVTAKPDAAGNSSTPTVKEQVDAFLAAGAPNADDLIIVNAGFSDVITQVRQTLEGTQTSDQMLANLDQAGIELGEQVKRLVNAGAQHVVVSGTYDLGRSPWAIELGTDALLHPASSTFNNSLLVSLVDFGKTILYVDAALYFNQQTADSANNVNNKTTAACTSVDPGPGIGTGNGQVNSRLCTPATILPNQDYNVFMFADRVYPTPRGHQLFGDYARGRIQERW